MLRAALQDNPIMHHFLTWSLAQQLWQEPSERAQARRLLVDLTRATERDWWVEDAARLLRSLEAQEGAVGED